MPVMTEELAGYYAVLMHGRHLADPLVAYLNWVASSSGQHLGDLADDGVADDDSELAALEIVGLTCASCCGIREY